jgi:hypothetical protein
MVLIPCSSRLFSMSGSDILQGIVTGFDEAFAANTAMLR